MTDNGITPGSHARRISRLAVAALTCGILGLVIGPTSFIAVVLGHAARVRISYTGDKGSGIALAGLILGYLVVALILIRFFLGALTHPHRPALWIFPTGLGDA